MQQLTAEAAEEHRPIDSVSGAGLHQAERACAELIDDASPIERTGDETPKRPDRDWGLIGGGSRGPEHPLNCQYATCVRPKRSEWGLIRKGSGHWHRYLGCLSRPTR